MYYVRHGILWVYYYRLANLQFVELTPLTLERVGGPPGSWPCYTHWISWLLGGGSFQAPLLHQTSKTCTRAYKSCNVLTYMTLRQRPLSLEEIQAKEERRKCPRSHTKFVAEAGSELRFFFWIPGQWTSKALEPRVAWDKNFVWFCPKDIPRTRAWLPF